MSFQVNQKYAKINKLIRSIKKNYINYDLNIESLLKMRDYYIVNIIIVFHKLNICKKYLIIFSSWK